jgi:hypothetical protein
MLKGKRSVSGVRYYVRSHFKMTDSLLIVSYWSHELQQRAYHVHSVLSCLLQRNSWQEILWTWNSRSCVKDCDVNTNKTCYCLRNNAREYSATSERHVAQQTLSSLFTYQKYPLSCNNTFVTRRYPVLTTVGPPDILTGLYPFTACNIANLGKYLLTKKEVRIVSILVQQHLMSMGSTISERSTDCFHPQHVQFTLLVDAM